jgi:hypothetical protein
MVTEHKFTTGGSQVREFMLPHTTAVEEGFDALRVVWGARASAELESRQKGERRRQRSARLMGLEPVDPNDSLPYTVYPIEPEVMVRVCDESGFNYSCMTH